MLVLKGVLLAVWPTVLVLEFVCFAGSLACLYIIDVPACACARVYLFNLYYICNNDGVLSFAFQLFARLFGFDVV